MNRQKALDMSRKEIMEQRKLETRTVALAGSRISA